MRELLHTEFAVLLFRAGVSQSAFADLTGYTPRQVNNWCRGRARVPRWAAVLAVVLPGKSPLDIKRMVESASRAGGMATLTPPGASSGTEVVTL
jgi:hypothetical protein